MADEAKMTVDPQSSMKIRATDNSLKEGDFEAPQTKGPLKLDKNGLPEFVYDLIEEAVH